MLFYDNNIIAFQNKDIMKKILTTSILLATAGLFVTTFAIDDNTVRVGKIQQKAACVNTKALHMDYRATQMPDVMPKTLRQNTTGSIMADFSVQNGTSQESVWSEGFDNGSLADWTQDNGEGNEVSFTLKQPKGDKAFTSIDPNDKASLYVDGPINVIRRTIGTLTSKDIAVPANAQLHAYTYFDPMWNEYATLSITASADNFDTQTELWNSKDVDDKDSKWRPMDVDLSAFAGKDIKLRIVYGPGTNDGFGVGGYLGSFYVDGMSVTGVKTVDQINVKTGEEIQFTDLSTGSPTSWEWSFPGGTPETSTDQNPKVYYTKPGSYDVTLKVAGADGENVVTKKAFVSVEGQEPVAKIGFPADFRDLTTRTRMVAPLATVHYSDESAGYPDKYSWAIYSEYELKNNTSTIFTPSHVYTTKDVDFNHEKLNKYYVTHIAQNETGYTYQDDSVQVQFDGMITNFEPKDGYQTNFTDGELTLPGANNLDITAWAEKFSKPSRPMLLTGVYVNFTKAAAEELIDQIANVSFSLYTSENGVPGKKIDLLDTWTLTELNYALTTNQGIVELQLNRKYVINDEFFIVIDGIPEKSETTECSFAMAPMRDHGNTAYMLKKGKWQPFTGYLQAAPGGQTSLAVFPVVRHSVIIPAQISSEGEVTVDNDSVVVGKEAGTVSKTIFSQMGWKDAKDNSSWCRITNKPGEYTADILQIEYDALPDGVDDREGYVSITDSVDVLKLRVVQHRKSTSGIDSAAVGDTPNANVELYDLNGCRITSANLPKGIYIMRQGNKTRKIVRK